MFRLVVHRCIYFNIPWEDTFNMLEMKRESMRRELAFARLRQGRSYRWSWRHMPSNREAPNTNKKREQKKRESEKGKRVRRQNAWTTSYTFPLISCLVNSHFILQVGPMPPPPSISSAPSIGRLMLRHWHEVRWFSAAFPALCHISIPRKPMGFRAT